MCIILGMSMWGALVKCRVMSMRAPILFHSYFLRYLGCGAVMLGRYSYMTDLRILESKVSPRPLVLHNWCR